MKNVFFFLIFNHNFIFYYQVFGTARSQDQQSLVIQWILLSLANFTEAATGAEDFAVWNILCFFCAASNNPWLKSL